MCACANSARASRLSWGMCQEPSTTRTLRRPRLAVSHSVVTSGDVTRARAREVTGPPVVPTARVELDANVLAEAVEERHQRPGELGGEEGPLHAVSGHAGRVVAHRGRGVPSRI